MKRYSLVAAALLFAGCQDHAPTELIRESATTSPNANTTASALLALDDAANRLIPSLDVQKRKALSVALNRLRQTVGSEDVVASATLVHGVTLELDRYEKLEPGSEAELDAIRLALGLVSNDR